MVNYLHQFAPNLATVSSSLTELAGSTATCDWTPVHSNSFQKVKNTLAADAAVRPLNYNSSESIYVVTAASLIGTGAWVVQAANKNEIRAEHFHSRKFNTAEENYSTFDKELLAIVDGL